ncbi:uncharacterized protein LOC108998997 [Juglans regia]|uniref:Uncharacterized protein LOC108998997 n=1 Tax=Juglans regia TaxID=51240 RepID=A0A6P9EBG1_JUGRE|nr:uncharacterized protein LOC108998997 [Juglans regia]
MDAYSGYNQIRMKEADQEKIAFITDRELYCYKVMSFGLKNVGATYQRLVNKMFKDQIERNKEVSVDDLLVKSMEFDQHVEDLREAFHVLCRYQMKLNPTKCAFGVQLENFLSFMVLERGIEANPEKIRAIMEMKSPTNFNKSHQAIGAIIAILSLTLDAVSAALIREEGKEQKLVYYVSRALRGADARYQKVGLVAFVVVVVARRFWPYFQAHPIKGITSSPLHKVLQKLDISGWLVKWSIELSEYDISYIPKSVVKGQILTDFVAKFSNFREEIHKPPEKNLRQVYVDGSACRAGGGVDAHVVTSEGEELYHAVRLEFKVTNNEAEYETILASVAITRVLGGEEVEMKVDSQVVVGKITGEYLERGTKLIKYLHQVQE